MEQKLWYQIQCKWRVSGKPSSGTLTTVTIHNSYLYNSILLSLKEDRHPRKIVNTLKGQMFNIYISQLTVMHIIYTIPYCAHSWLITGLVSPVEWELITLPEHLHSLCFLWSSCCWIFGICVVCCRQLLVFLSIFFCQLYCMSFELKFLFYHFGIFKLVFTTQMYTKYNDNNNNNMQPNIPGNLQKRHRNVSILWFFYISWWKKPL